MTFESAVTGLHNGMAAKVPAMTGYVKREDYVRGAEDDWSEKYDITFVLRDGTQFRYVHTVKDGKVSVEAPDGRLDLDPQMLSAMLTGTWGSYRLADVEAARSSKDARW